MHSPASGRRPRDSEWPDLWLSGSVRMTVMSSLSSNVSGESASFRGLPRCGVFLALLLGLGLMERSMLNITYKDRKTNIWVREKTKVIDIITTVRKMKWSWAGHINRLKDDRWTSRVTTWRPYDKKRRQGRPAKRWRDDLDKYWSDTIWQRKAQDRVIWRQHAEAFAQPRDTTAA